MKNFILIGVGGYIAPRHLEAIKNTGNNLLAALDKHDSVGILDKYFPGADFFTEFERFDRHIDKLKRQGTPVHYLSVCSPNYLHDAHIRFGLRTGADVVCEKPLVLNPWNAEALLEMEKETGCRVNVIQQLRLHPSAIQLKDKVDNSDPGHIFPVELKYISARGNWYRHSWKGDEQKSGGVATNIGIHLFDLLIWIFGSVKNNRVNVYTPETASGVLELERATVNWTVSIDAQLLPPGLSENGGHTYRMLSVNGNEFDFSSGLSELHTKSYEAILNNNGFGIPDAIPAIRLVHDIRKKNSK